MPPQPQGVHLVIMGAACAPAALLRAIDKHLQPRRSHGWDLVRSDGPRLLPALRQATMVLLFCGPTLNGDEVRALLDEGLHSEHRILQVSVTYVELPQELDAQPIRPLDPACLDPANTEAINSEADALLRLIAEQAVPLPPRSSYSVGPHIVRADLLGVDRKHQWEAIKAASAAQHHLALLVSGAHEEGHDYFHARIQYLWPQRRARVFPLVGLDPAGFASRDQFEQAVRTAIPCSPDAATGLGRALAVGDVVLLWPVLHAGQYSPEALREALWSWIPALLAEAEQQRRLRLGYLRVIVNLEWLRIPTWARLTCPLLPRFMHRGALRWAAQCRRLRREVRLLRRDTQPLRIQRLPDLQPIAKQDVITHLEGLPKDEFDALAKVADDAQDSRHLLGLLQEAARRRDAAKASTRTTP